MWFNRMSLEDWFDTYQYETKYDVGESAVKYLTFDEINIDLGKLPIRYGYHLGRPDLREVLAEQYKGLTPEQILVTAGGSEANFAIVSSLVKPGDQVIVEHPNYPSLYEVPRSLGCEVTLFHLKFENAFVPDLDELNRLITPRTKLVTLTHPNNPTGSMISEKMLHEIIKVIESHKNLYLLFDETYRELAYKEMLPTAASLSPRVISISSMSKCYGLPGIRIGWLATKDASIIKSVLAIREQVSITNCAISEEIAVSVLKRKDVFLRRAQEHVGKNFKIVCEWMKDQKKLEWIIPEAGVVSLPRIKPDSIGNTEDLFHLLVKKYKTFMIPGRCFEMDNRFFRLGFGGTSDELKVGLKNINSALEEMSGK